MYIINPLKGMGGLLFGADQSRIEGILGPPEFMVGEGVYQYTGLVVVAREGRVYPSYVAMRTARRRATSSNAPVEQRRESAWGPRNKNLLPRMASRPGDEFSEETLK